MDFHEEAFVLSARAHGDTGAVADLLTETHGRRSAYVAGGASRKMRPFLQAGARVVADYRARTSDHLGAARLEPVGEGPSALFDDALALTGLAARDGGIHKLQALSLRGGIQLARHLGGLPVGVQERRQHLALGGSEQGPGRRGP